MSVYMIDFEVKSGSSKDNGQITQLDNQGNSPHRRRGITRY